MIPVSWLSKYLYCPRQLWLEQIKGIKSEENAKMVAGSIVHKLLSKVYKAQVGILDATTKEMTEENFKEAFVKKFLSESQEIIVKNLTKLKQFQLSPVELFDKYVQMLRSLAYMKAKEAYAFASTFHLYGEELTDNYFPKYQADVYLESNNLELKGSIDIIEIFKEERVPMELKTSTPPSNGAWDTDQIQLAAYIILLAETEEVTKGSIMYINHNKRVPVVINDFLRDRVFSIRDNILKLIETKVEPQLPETKDRCKKCSFKKECYNHS